MNVYPQLVVEFAMLKYGFKHVLLLVQTGFVTMGQSAGEWSAIAGSPVITLRKAGLKAIGRHAGSFGNCGKKKNF
jgi:hypothetical protein